MTAVLDEGTAFCYFGASVKAWQEPQLGQPRRRRLPVKPGEMEPMMGWPSPFMSPEACRAVWDTCERIQGCHMIHEPVPGFVVGDAQMCKCGRMVVFDRALAGLSAWQRNVFEQLRREGWAAVLPSKAVAVGEPVDESDVPYATAG